MFWGARCQGGGGFEFDDSAAEWARWVGMRRKEGNALGNFLPRCPAGMELPRCRWGAEWLPGLGVKSFLHAQGATEPGRWGNIEIVKIAPLTLEGRWGNGHRGSSLWCCCAVCATGRELKKKKRTRLPELPGLDQSQGRNPCSTVSTEQFRSRAGQANSKFPRAGAASKMTVRPSLSEALLLCVWLEVVKFQVVPVASWAGIAWWALGAFNLRLVFCWRDIINSSIHTSTPNKSVYFHADQLDMSNLDWSQPSISPGSPGPPERNVTAPARALVSRASHFQAIWTKLLDKTNN